MDLIFTDSQHLCFYSLKRNDVSAFLEQLPDGSILMSITGHIKVTFMKSGLSAVLSWVDTIVAKVPGTWNRAVGTWAGIRTESTLPQCWKHLNLVVRWLAGGKQRSGLTWLDSASDPGSPGGRE